MMGLVLVALGAHALWRRRTVWVAAAIAGWLGVPLGAAWQALYEPRGAAERNVVFEALLRQEPWTRYVTVAWGTEAAWPAAACRMSCPQAALSWARARAAPPPYAAAAARGRALCATWPRPRGAHSAAWHSPRLWWPPPRGAACSTRADLQLYLPAQGAAQACIDVSFPAGAALRLDVQAGDDAFVAATAPVAAAPLRIGDVPADREVAALWGALQCKPPPSAERGRRCVATAIAPAMRQSVRWCGPAALFAPAAPNASTWQALPCAY